MYLILILFLLSLLFASRLLYKKEVDHFFFLSIGFAYYYFVPFIGLWLYPRGIYWNLFEWKYNYYSEVGYELINDYLIISLCSFIFLIIGDYCSRKFTVNESINIGNKTFDATFYCFLILGIYLFYGFRDNLFQGYMAVQNWPRERAWIIGVCSVFIVFNSLHMAKNKNAELKSLILNKYFIFALLSNLLYLSAGGRSLIFAFIVSILLFILMRLNFRTGLLFLGVTVFTFITIFLVSGRLRKGDWEIDQEDLRFEFFSETTNVGVTLGHYLKEPNFELFSFPSALLSQFSNLIPAIIYPAKYELMFSHPDVIKFQATSHLHVDLIVNFGLIGMWGIFFLIGYSMNYLKNLSYGVYLSISSVMMFHIFRAFEVTLIKNILQYSILLPLAMVIVDRILKKVKNMKVDV